MTRRLLLLASAFAATPLVATSAAAAPAGKSILLKVGDAVDVKGTGVACFAITSSSKPGIACVLWAKTKPLVGSFGAGLAVDGTAILNRLAADGTGTPIFKRRLQARTKTYAASVGDSFGLTISSTVSLGCRVLDISSNSLAAIYQGVRVSCWRATATAPLPNTYGVSISDRFAGVFRFDAKGNTTAWGVIRKQP